MFNKNQYKELQVSLGHLGVEVAHLTAVVQETQNEVRAIRESTAAYMHKLLDRVVELVMVRDGFPRDAVAHRGQAARGEKSIWEDDEGPEETWPPKSGTVVDMRG